LAVKVIPFRGLGGEVLLVAVTAKLSSEQITARLKKIPWVLTAEVNSDIRAESPKK
jgi:hypothetical protein